MEQPLDLLQPPASSIGFVGEVWKPKLLPDCVMQRDRFPHLFLRLLDTFNVLVELSSSVDSCFFYVRIELNLIR